MSGLRMLAMGEAWPVFSVAELAVEHGLVGGPFGSSLVSKDYRPAGVPVIRGTNMPASPGRFVGGDFVYVDGDKRQALRRNLARPGDVVFTQRGTLGQVALVPPGPYPEYVVSQSQMRLRPDPALVLPEFVYWLFRSESMVASIVRSNTATANPHINLGILAAIQVPVPPLRTQRLIVRLLDAVDHCQTAELNAASGVQSLSRALVGKLFESGERREASRIFALAYGKALKAEDRLGGPVRVLGAAGPVGTHDRAMTPGPAIVVGRKGVKAVSSLPYPIRLDASAEGHAQYRGQGGAGSIRWESGPAWVIDTAFVVQPLGEVDLRLLYWSLVAADLPLLATTTTLPGLNRDAVLQASVPWNSGDVQPLLDAVDAAEQSSVMHLQAASRYGSLRSALLDDLLSGRHEIPESYDALLDEATA